MIKYNYNEACIATWEELEPLYDADEGSYKISDNPEIDSRFRSIPGLIKKGIIPFITLHYVRDETEGFIVLFAESASVAPGGDDPDSISVLFPSEANWIYEEGVLQVD